MNLMRACYFGTLTFYQGDYDRAIADYSELIQVEPFQSKKYGPNPAVFFNRGQAYRHKGEYDKAIADFTECIRLRPKGADAVQAHLNRADVFLMRGRYKEAVEDCTETIRLDSTNAIAYLGRGMAFGLDGEYDKAIADFTDALRLETTAATYFYRGNAYRMKQDNDRAISDYTAAIRLDPLYIDAYKNRAGTYRALGHEANAVSDESKVSELMQWRGGTLSSS